MSEKDAVEARDYRVEWRRERPGSVVTGSHVVTTTDAGAALEYAVEADHLEWEHVTAVVLVDRTYVRFTEVNDHEGETWHSWLQVTGNEEELRKFAALLDAWTEAHCPDTGEAPYELDRLEDALPGRDVRLLVRYADQGYASAHRLVRGTFTCPAVDVTREEPLECLLYKLGVSDLFQRGDRE